MPDPKIAKTTLHPEANFHWTEIKAVPTGKQVRF